MQTTRTTQKQRQPAGPFRNPMHSSGTSRPARPAFTMLELLIVIVIIGILVSLLLVVLGTVGDRVTVATVKAEFNQLEQAIATFKTAHGVIPPSRITLTEDPGANPWDSQTRSFLRRMFGATVDFSQTVDFNKDGDTGDVLTLTSSECLVFFLGGMKDGPDGTTLTGFSANRETPFARGGNNRIGPYFHFDPGRLIDADNDGMFEYLDQVSEEGVAMIYVSSNNGQGYKNADGSVAYYHANDGITPINADSFQLISPGEDGDFGFDPEPNPFVTLIWTPGVAPGGAQNDNIANFSSGTLGQ